MIESAGWWAVRGASWVQVAMVITEVMVRQIRAEFPRAMYLTWSGPAGSSLHSARAGWVRMRGIHARPATVAPHPGAGVSPHGSPHELGRMPSILALQEPHACFSLRCVGHAVSEVRIGSGRFGSGPGGARFVGCVACCDGGLEACTSVMISSCTSRDVLSAVCFCASDVEGSQLPMPACCCEFCWHFHALPNMSRVVARSSRAPFSVLVCRSSCSSACAWAA